MPIDSIINLDDVISFESIDCLQTIKGEFTPEQFSVFLNASMREFEDKYIVHFHECFHHWQSIFTPYGHLKWARDRDISSEVIKLWIEATKETPSERIIPASGLIPCQTIEQARCLFNIYTQDKLSRIIALEERTYNNEELQKLITVAIEDICPRITLNGKEYKLNGIDIIESFAKFQESTFANIVDGETMSSTIDPTKLPPEYYSALLFFISKVGGERIAEFPILCELALCSDELCKFYKEHNWRNHHPAWRFIKFVDTISSSRKIKPLSIDSIKSHFVEYSEQLLEACGFKGHEQYWESSIHYASNGQAHIGKNMLKAIMFKKKYPWILSFPFIDKESFMQLKEYVPYFYVTNDLSMLTVSSPISDEVIFECHYQALAHQIRGNMSRRCLDRYKLQCGFSYYGLKNCKYYLEDECNGHIDNTGILPEVKIGDDGTILEGCSFDLFLTLMEISIKDIIVRDINTKIDINVLEKNAKNLVGNA